MRTFFGTPRIFNDFFKESGRNILPWWQTRKKKKKKKRGHSREHPPNVKVDEQATDKKSYKHDHEGQIRR
jgi:hypothetical protein